MFLSFILSLVLSSVVVTSDMEVASGFVASENFNKIQQDIPIKDPESNSMGIEVSAEHAVVVDRKTGAILFSKQAEEVQPIASITKVMSALVFLDFNPGWEIEVTMQASDERQGGYFHVYRGEIINMRDLFNLGLVASDNNSLIALMRSTGLSDKEFVFEMNRKAHILGLKNTKFVDPTGLSPQNESTALDVARMLNYALDKKEIRQALVQSSYEFNVLNNGRQVNVLNTDILLDSYLNDQSQGYKIIGGKTGYLIEAGFCLAMAVEKNGNQVIGVVLGSDTIETRFQEIKGLVTWAFDNYTW